MQTTPSSTYRLEHLDSSACIRLHCEPTPAHEPPRIVPQLSSPEKASRFVSRPVAELIAARYCSHLRLEIVRVDG